MSDAPTRKIGRVTLSPLFKDLIGPRDVDDAEITAALVLVGDGTMSEAQTSLLLGLLTARSYPLEDKYRRLLDSFLSDVESDQEDHDPAAPTIRKLLSGSKVQAQEIAEIFHLLLENQVNLAQSALFLGLLSFNGLDKEPLVLVKTAEKMVEAATRPDLNDLLAAVKGTSRPRGNYHGGLCDIVGTGGDGHSTFNVSTTASIIASTFLTLSKHGNRASSSTSGSADLLAAIQPRGPDVEFITAATLPSFYRQSSYAFLFAPVFHPGMKHVAPLRKDLGISTIFNVLGPLVNPVEECIEARIVGVAKKSMGPVFAEALRLSGVKKAMVVCGAENLDEISCAGTTFCWRLSEDDDVVRVDEFELEPANFGFANHSLAEVGGGKSPAENAEILIKMLGNELEEDDPVLHFVLINAAALFAIAGVCEDNEANENDDDLGEKVQERGPGGQRWKEGVRLAKKAIEDGIALRSLQRYIDATHSGGI